MSASLVGSEMCIRDRYPPARKGDSPLRGQQKAKKAHQQSSNGRKVVLQTCLLYTSDAADDM
eukprot:8855215-Alexandrium_andersonii.AAC.1